jgi:hypothetical protein
VTQDGIAGSCGHQWQEMRLLDLRRACWPGQQRGETTNTATVDTAPQWGNDLVKFTTHYPTCEVCAAGAGKGVSVSAGMTALPGVEQRAGF